MKEHIRVASTQYFIRPVASFREFADQVAGLAGTAADYKARLLVLPEYFTVQLLTLGDLKKPIKEQVRDLASQTPAFLDLMGGLAKKHGLYIVAGTIPRSRRQRRAAQRLLRLRPERRATTSRASCT